jgi:hypothetical protein
MNFSFRKNITTIVEEDEHHHSDTISPVNADQNKEAVSSTQPDQSNEEPVLVYEGDHTLHDTWNVFVLILILR